MPFPYPWQPGMRITAERLRAGLLTGTVSITPAESVSATGSLFTGTYLRGTATVSFPVGTFTETPRIFLTGRSSVPGVLLEVNYTDQSENGMTVVIARQTSTLTVVDWLAVAA
ncbi:hypothetical protein [Streptomyces sp. SCA2-2]|uniref:hypothetical protein n=1 Tax=Streptomyces sp. SCA2-2 TaxID=1563677 RepID=UPI001A92F668|nr:hypothetical protein [Streptomyces sp. SCA2-2]